MMEMLPWLRSRRSRKPSNRSERLNAQRVYGNLEIEHFAPKALIVNQYTQGLTKTIHVHSTGMTRIVYTNRDGKLITVSETAFADEETMEISVEGSEISSDSQAPKTPPINAEFFLHILLNSDEQDALVGDLSERYAAKYSRLGERRANVWYYCEVGRSLGPLLRRAVAKASGLIALSEWIRRHVS